MGGQHGKRNEKRRVKTRAFEDRRMSGETVRGLSQQNLLIPIKKFKGKSSSINMLLHITHLRDFHPAACDTKVV